MLYRKIIIIVKSYILDIVVLIIEIVPTIDVVLIVEFVSIVVMLIAEIVSTKDTLIIFKNIVVILTMRFVPAKVLFVNIKTN